MCVPLVPCALSQRLTTAAPVATASAAGHAAAAAGPADPLNPCPPSHAALQAPADGGARAQDDAAKLLNEGDLKSAHCILYWLLSPAADLVLCLPLNCINPLMFKCSTPFIAADLITALDIDMKYQDRRQEEIQVCSPA